MIQKVAQGDANVFLYGESGTGKELVARAIHYHGPRKDRPLIPLDCATIPAGLMESQLFGHVKGAFTGAVQTRDGVLALADSGTLFIDEIHDLPLHLQAKLLRFLQSREFTMVGGARPRKVNVRIITSANKDLHRAVLDGAFREDLYYRMAVVQISLPPLRERREDIPLLVVHFLQRCNARYRRAISHVRPEAMEALIAYDWPGNVRQLENAIEQAVVLAEAEVLGLPEFQDFFNVDGVTPPSRLPVFGLSLRELEKWYILETLRQIRGNRTQAARLLGISLRGLQYKLHRYTRGGQANPPGRTPWIMSPAGWTPEQRPPGSQAA
ncbi:MAG: sigma-54-dependent Fis family transcriptional regulator [candidate division NC10 bacterium]|nr:sigma-54-dependent Fis family transcriptional regulator [candidate division NC10 bacterium]